MAICVYHALLVASNVIMMKIIKKKSVLLVKVNIRKIVMIYVNYLKQIYQHVLIIKDLI